MKKTLLFVCGLLMCMSMQAADFENAKDAVKFMGVGWNLALMDIRFTRTVNRIQHFGDNLSPSRN